MRLTKMYSFLFWLHPVACRIFVPQLGIEPKPTALEAWGLNPSDCQGSP